MAVAVGLLCTAPSFAATLDRVDKGYWLAAGHESLSTTLADGQIVQKVAPARSDVRFRTLHTELPARMRGKVLTAEGLARAHLGLLDAVGAKRATQDTLKLANVSPLRNGAQIVRFRSEVGGIEVFRGDISLLLDGNQNLRALSGVWPSLPSQALGKAVPAYRLDAKQALGHALSGYGFSDGAVATSSRRAPSEGGYVSLFVSDALRGGTDEQVHSARAKQVLFPIGNRLIPAWYVETVVGQSGVPDSEYYAHVIDATNGDVLFRHNQTENEDYQYNVWAEGAGYLPYPGPQGRQTTPYPAASDQGLTPAAVPTELITLQNVPFSMNDPWLPNGAGVTTGNNTEAYTDAGTEGFNPADGDIRGTAFTSGGPVPPPYDPTLNPDASLTQRDAAVRQMFYFVNWTHDWYYDAGFDEASGNAQANNFGRGGAGSDSVKSEGQDNSNYPGNNCFPNCSNNANMSTPADGGRPRMQMFTWSAVGAVSFTRQTPLPAHPSGGVGTPGWNSTSHNLTDDIVQATDVAGDGDGTGTTTDGCSAFGNAAAVNGNIAFVDRGSCNFVVKVQNAFAAGAAGIVIGNLVGSAAPATMGDGGTPPTPAGALNLPALLISFADGQDLRTALINAPGAVTGSLLRSVGIRPDGTVDNQIMAHELGHYISNRLVHNSAGLTTNHSRGLGEGWGDFHSQLMTVKEEDLGMSFGADYAGAYGMAAYSTGDYWAGIRTFPYSTDFDINPLTYGDLIINTQVHAAGEIWASSLWQCYAGILNSGLSFADAQQRMKEYLIAGYKLTPPGPFFTEARDAVLAAIIASGETADFEVCAAAFAMRGAGIYAVPPNDRAGGTNAGVVEDFTIDGKITLSDIGNIDDSAAACDVDGVLDVGEEGLVTLPFNNVGWLNLSDSEVQVSSDFSGLVFPDGATYAVADTVPYQSQTVQIPVRLDSAPGGPVTVTFTATDPDVGVAPSPLVAPIAMNFDYILAASDTFNTSTFDTSVLGWHTLEESGATSSKKWVKRNVSGAQVAFGTNFGSAGVAWLETPVIEAGPAALSVQLSHRYSFEAGAEPDGNYDGGVVEISVDGGAWAALDLPEYTNTLSGCCSNPMAGRDAFTLASAGYPAFTPLTINLGTTYDGSDVRLRFGMAEDAGSGGAGWDIDTVTVAGALNQPFPVGTGLQITSCGAGNTAPVLTAAAAADYAENGTGAVLTASAIDVQNAPADLVFDLGGADAGLFVFDSVSGELSLQASPDFESPADAGGDNVYDVTLTVTDTGDLSDTQAIAITVTGINEAPTIVDQSFPVDEDAANDTEVGTIAYADPDAGGSHTVMVTGGSGQGVFGVSATGVITVTDSAALTEGSSFTLDVTVTDNGALTDTAVVTITVAGVNHAPVAGTLADVTAQFGTLVSIDAGVVFTDEDGDLLTFALSSVPGLPASLDFDTATGVISGTPLEADIGSYEITVTATDPDSAEASVTFTLTIVGEHIFGDGFED